MIEAPIAGGVSSSKRNIVHAGQTLGGLKFS